MGIELQNPVAHDLQRHAADLRRLGGCRPLIDRSQGEKPPRLWPILCLFRYRAKTRRIKISPKPNRRRHGDLPPFATLNEWAAPSARVIFVWLGSVCFNVSGLGLCFP